MDALETCLELFSVKGTAPRQQSAATHRAGLCYNPPPAVATTQFILHRRPSHGRDEVPQSDLAAQEVVAISLHSAEGHVSGCFHEGDVEPDGDVLKLCTLQLVYGAGIPRTNRVGGHVAAVLDPIGYGVDSQVAARLSQHMHTPGCRVIAFHNGLHAVDEVGALVHVSGDVHPHVFVEIHGQWLRRPPQHNLVLIVEVVGVRLPVHLQLSQLPLALGGEEHPYGEVVHMGGRFPGACCDRGVRHIAVELLKVPSRWLVVP